MQYGLLNLISDSIKANYIKVSVWRKGEDKNGQIVASRGTKFYQSVNSGSVPDSAGWVKMELNFLMPGNAENEPLKIYLWNSGKEPVFFDDFEIRFY